MKTDDIYFNKEKTSNIDSLSSNQQSHESSDGNGPLYSVSENIAGNAYNGLHPDIVHSSFLSSSSTVRVEIADIDNDEVASPIAFAIKRCKKLVLNPYHRILVMIGWRSLGKDSVNFGTWTWKLINIIYTFLVICFLLYSYFYQVLLCPGKLNIHSDTIPAVIINEPENISDETTAGIVMSPGLNNSHHHKPFYSNPQCSHIVSTYIIPSFFHLLIYVLGFIHFRLQDNEHLCFIIQKVFLQADQSSVRSSMQSRIVKNSQLILYAGAAWVFVTVCLQFLYLIVFKDQLHTLEDTQNANGSLLWPILIPSLEVVGAVVYSSIFMAVIVNYVLQCELLIFYIDDICTHMHEKTIDVKLAMQNILNVRESISRINGPLARMTALSILTFAQLTVIGACLLILNKIESWEVWCYRVVFLIVWFLSMFVPLFQAARVTKHGEKLRQISFQMRIFGYRKSSQIDLDSFILFVGNATLRTKLFSVPIKASLLMGIAALVVFLLIILFQTGIIGNSQIFL